MTPWIVVAGLADDSLSLGGAKSETSFWRFARPEPSAAVDLRLRAGIQSWG
jgi:hypothetical protein